MRKYQNPGRCKNGELTLPVFVQLVLELNLFRYLGSLAYAAAQVVQLGAADFTAAYNLELCYVRGVYLSLIHI